MTTCPHFDNIKFDDCDTVLLSATLSRLIAYMQTSTCLLWCKSHF